MLSLLFYLPVDIRDTKFVLFVSSTNGRVTYPFRFSLFLSYPPSMTQMYLSKISKRVNQNHINIFYNARQMIISIAIAIINAKNNCFSIYYKIYFTWFWLTLLEILNQKSELPFCFSILKETNIPPRRDIGTTSF